MPDQHKTRERLSVSCVLMSEQITAACTRGDKRNYGDWSEVLRCPTLSVYAGTLEMQAREVTTVGM